MAHCLYRVRRPKQPVRRTALRVYICQSTCSRNQDDLAKNKTMHLLPPQNFTFTRDGHVLAGGVGKGIIFPMRVPQNRVGHRQNRTLMQELVNDRWESWWKGISRSVLLANFFFVLLPFSFFSFLIARRAQI